MDVFDNILKFLEEIEDDASKHPEKYFDIKQEDYMGQLDKESEDLLKEILENDKGFPEILRKKFEGLDWEDISKLCAKISVLIKGGYISELGWADNVPWDGRIEQKGRAYFEMKEQEQMKGFKSWEKILFDIIKAEESNKEYNPPKNRDEELDFLQKKGFVDFARTKATKSMAIIYFEIKSKMFGREYINDRLSGKIANDTVSVNTQNFYGNVVDSNIQQATINSTQAIKSFPDITSIISEIKKEIDGYKLDGEQKSDLLETVDEVEKADKVNNTSKLKRLLFGIGGILKDFAVGVAASALANKI